MARPPLAERLYRLLLRCYPGEFRDEYEREMLQVFRDRIGHDGRAGRMALLHLWAQVAWDAIARAPGEHLDVARQDVRYAWRSLRRAPVFAGAAIATLAIGIASTTAIFSVVHAVSLRPLPWDPAGRLVRIWEDNPSLGISGFAVSLPNYVSWRERARTLDLAAWMEDSATVHGTQDPVRVPLLYATADLFDLLGAAPRRGRLFDPADTQRNGAAIAIVTDGLWRRHYGEDPTLVGQSILIDGAPHAVVGIVDATWLPVEADVVVPLRINLAEEDRSNHIAQVVGRLRPDATVQAARDEIAGIARQLEQEFPDSNRGWTVLLTSAADWVVPPDTRRALQVLLGAVACVLLVACANVASLMLTRAAVRRREMAVRLAIGAARRRLVRQVLTEGALLAVLGGAAGILLAYWSVPFLRRWLPESLPRADEVAVNGPVLAFSLAICALTAVAFALLPALTGSRAAVVGSLKDGSRGTTGATAGWRQALTAAQIALATILVAGAGLLFQSLQRLQHVDLGFDPAGITVGMTGLPPDRYDGPDARWAFFRELLTRIEAAPGVEAAAISSIAPFENGNTGMPVDAVGPSRLNGEPLQADWRMVSPAYFSALRVPLVRGRFFTGHREADAQTMIVSALMARRIWGDEDPLGRQIAAGPAGHFTIVGIVGDVRQLDLAAAPVPTMYISTANYVRGAMTVLVRAGEAAQPADLLRRTVRALDPQLAVYNVAAMPAQVGRSAAQPRLHASLVGLFAVAAALLAGIGLYGVMAWLVVQRRQEIGIRLALGADRRAVLRLFLGRAVTLTAAGLLAGVAGALAVSAWIATMMFEVSPRDPWTIAAAAVLVAGVALYASWLPARRATRIDPLVALRSE